MNNRKQASSKTEKTTQVMVYLPDSLAKKLDRDCKTFLRSRPSQIVYTLQEHYSQIEACLTGVQLTSKSKELA